MQLRCAISFYLLRQQVFPMKLLFFDLCGLFSQRALWGC